MPAQPNKLRRFFKTLGPGILFASTAIGVSHLVQSTRAGANFGFALLWAVILANLFKYPFFEYGSRYANATGRSIIDGYLKIGKWMLWIYFIITIGSMFFVVAAVGFVTAGFMENLFGLNANGYYPLMTTMILFVVCLGILMTGKFSILDGLVKVIGVVMLISTVVAFVLTLFHGPVPAMEGFKAPEVWNEVGIGFLIALMGWMPTAVDLSAWNSLWTVERIRQTGYKPTIRETLLDFNIGYITSAVLSICFVTLGAFLIYGSGKTMAAGGAGFANGVVNLYTETIGDWSYIIIAAAAFSIMFGTSIAVFDGYARAIERTSELLFFGPERQEALIKDRFQYKVALMVIAAGAFVLIGVFHNKPNGFKALVDLATTISFIVAPVIAIVNFRLVSPKYIEDQRALPPKWMKGLSYAGILFLAGFTVFYFVVKIRIWFGS